jgi:uncharacterized protein (DUF1810 family)
MPAATPSPAFDLDRFLDAQAGVYDAACAELRAGRKRSHWMWFVFPQLRGLGTSATAHRFGIASLAEARAYLAHPVLGPRLREAYALALAVPGRSAAEIFGEVDAMKLRSSATLFRAAAPGEPLFQAVLDRFHGGIGDVPTEALLRAAASAPPG